MIRPATIQDAHKLAPRLRKADRMEIAATSGCTPLKALLTGARLSDQYDAWEINGRVEALSGARQFAPGQAIPWLVGSDAIFGAGKWAFARMSRPYFEAMNARWPLLAGRVWSGNCAHLRWVEWCGFQIYDTEPAGVLGEPFHPFTRTA